MPGEIPLIDENGKLQESHLPKYLTAEEFDPKVNLVDLFEQSMNAGG